MNRKRFFLSALFVFSAFFALTSCGEKKAETEKSEVTVTVTATETVTPAADNNAEVTEAPANGSDNNKNAVDDNKEKPKTDFTLPDGEEAAIYCVPVFSTESGFYDEDFELEITSADPDAEIYYTTDGNTPDEKSAKYEGPITLSDRTYEANFLSAKKGINPSEDYTPKKRVTKANVIRAVAVLPDGSKTEISNGTFFVGVDREKNYGDAPVISMFTDHDNLFDYDKGIYVMGRTNEEWLKEDPGNKYMDGWQQKGNYSNKGREWERPATLEYLPADDTEGFEIDLGIRIMGAASRGNNQKSFRLTCRKDYGQKNLKYELIPDNERSDGNGNVQKYKSFVLRNGGNDCDYTKFRDPLLQDLVSERSFETQQTDRAVLFIDGEYWGVYGLYEDYNDNYFENNYDVEDNNVIIVKRSEIEEGEEEDIELYNEMFEFITENDMSDADNYNKASEMFDMTAFAEYCAFNIYIYNEDSIFKDNNWQMWRVRETSDENEWADGKWRMMVYDTEYSTSVYGDGKNFKKDMLKSAMNEKSDKTGCKLLVSLLANDEFKSLFVNSLCDMRNVDFEENRVSERIDYWNSKYELLVPETFNRFGPSWITDWNDPKKWYEQKVSELRKWMTGRYGAFTDQIKNDFAFNDPFEVTFSSSDFEKGGFSLNTSTIVLSEDYLAKYFAECPFSVTARPAEGQEFDHWETWGGELAEGYSSEDKTVKVVPGEGCKVIVVYK